MADELQQLKDQIIELQRQNEELNNKLQEVDTLKRKLEEIDNIVRNHRHRGSESIMFERMVQDAQYIDGKEFRADGTVGGTGTVAIGDPAKTIVYKKGLIISIT